MTHVRSGRRAKQRRRERAAARDLAQQKFRAAYHNMTPEEQLVVGIFGAYEKCEECLNLKLIGSDCQTPHCKILRNERSIYYDEVVDDHVTVHGATMYAGVDY